MKTVRINQVREIAIAEKNTYQWYNMDADILHLFRTFASFSPVAAGFSRSGRGSDGTMRRTPVARSALWRVLWASKVERAGYFSTDSVPPRRAAHGHCNPIFFFFH